MDGTASSDVDVLEQPAPDAARALLGHRLVRRTKTGTCRVRIVETEAYTENDPASHSYRGPTPRSEVMFGPPGYWYIYKCYGIHWMVNAVCAREGRGEAVLIRAAEPVDGLTVMRERRGREGVELLNGPGKLAEALAVDESLQGRRIRPGSGLYLESGPTPSEQFASPRVGIETARERPWRFFTESDYVSSSPRNRQSRRLS